MKKSVLLTGATGFIGRHAIAPLIARGYEIHAVTSKPERTAQNVHWHRANLLDARETAQLVAGVRPTHLLHFAWYAEPGKFWKSKENFRWLEAGIALLQRFSESGGRRAVMAGSCAEYDWDYGYCSEAVTPCRPQTPYGTCKLALQEVLRSYSETEKLSSAWGRLFHLYGPAEHPARLVSSVITSLLGNETAKCTHGSQIRDFMHVEDAASAFAALLDSDVEGPVNISTGTPVTLRKVVLAAADCLGMRERVHFGAIAAPEGEPPLLVGDCRRLAIEVGWHQQLELHKGMEKTVDWWKKKGTGIS